MEEKDWNQILADFSATKEAKPNLTQDEWFEKFPEFNNDNNLLQAAYDYDATVKSGKYKDDQATLQSKFPEFWGSQPQTEEQPKQQQPKVTTQSAAQPTQPVQRQRTDTPYIAMDEPMAVDEVPEQYRAKYATLSPAEQRVVSKAMRQKEQMSTPEGRSEAAYDIRTVARNAKDKETKKRLNERADALDSYNKFGLYTAEQMEEAEAADKAANEMSKTTTSADGMLVQDNPERTRIKNDSKKIKEQQIKSIDGFAVSMGLPTTYDTPSAAKKSAVKMFDQTEDGKAINARISDAEKTDYLDFLATMRASEDPDMRAVAKMFDEQAAVNAEGRELKAIGDALTERFNAINGKATEEEAKAFNAESKAFEKRRKAYEDLFSQYESLENSGAIERFNEAFNAYLQSDESLTKGAIDEYNSAIESMFGGWLKEKGLPMEQNTFRVAFSEFQDEMDEYKKSEQERLYGEASEMNTWFGQAIAMKSAESRDPYSMSSPMQVADYYMRDTQKLMAQHDTKGGVLRTLEGIGFTAIEPKLWTFGVGDVVDEAIVLDIDKKVMSGVANLSAEDKALYDSAVAKGYENLTEDEAKVLEKAAKEGYELLNDEQKIIYEAKTMNTLAYQLFEPDMWYKSGVIASECVPFIITMGGAGKIGQGISKTMAGSSKKWVRTMAKAFPQEEGRVALGRLGATATERMKFGQIAKKVLQGEARATTEGFIYAGTTGAPQTVKTAMEYMMPQEIVDINLETGDAEVKGMMETDRNWLEAAAAGFAMQWIEGKSEGMSTYLYEPGARYLGGRIMAGLGKNGERYYKNIARIAFNKEGFMGQASRRISGPVFEYIEELDGAFDRCITGLSDWDDEFNKKQLAETAWGLAPMEALFMVKGGTNLALHHKRMAKAQEYLDKYAPETKNLYERISRMSTYEGQDLLDKEILNIMQDVDAAKAAGTFDEETQKKFATRMNMALAMKEQLYLDEAAATMKDENLRNSLETATSNLNLESGNLVTAEYTDENGDKKQVYVIGTNKDGDLVLSSGSKKFTAAPDAVQVTGEYSPEEVDDLIINARSEEMLPEAPAPVVGEEYTINGDPLVGHSLTIDEIGEGGYMTGTLDGRRVELSRRELRELVQESQEELAFAVGKIDAFRNESKSTANAIANSNDVNKHALIGIRGRNARRLLVELLGEDKVKELESMDDGQLAREYANADIMTRMMMRNWIENNTEEQYFNTLSARQDKVVGEQRRTINQLFSNPQLSETELAKEAKGGTLTMAKVDGNEVIVVADNGDAVIVSDKDGNTKMVSATQLEDVKKEDKNAVVSRMTSKETGRISQFNSAYQGDVFAPGEAVVGFDEDGKEQRILIEGEDGSGQVAYYTAYSPQEDGGFIPDKRSRHTMYWSQMRDMIEGAAYEQGQRKAQEQEEDKKVADIGELKENQEVTVLHDNKVRTGQYSSNGRQHFVVVNENGKNDVIKYDSLDDLKKEMVDALEPKKAEQHQQLTEQAAEMSELEKEFQQRFETEKDKEKVLKEFLDTIKTEEYVMLNKENIDSTLEEAVRQGRMEQQTANEIKAMYQIARITGERMGGFYVGGQIYMVSDQIKDIEHARTTYVHERQHGITKKDVISHGKDSTRAKVMAQASAAELADYVRRLCGSNAYNKTEKKGLAEEFISMAMEKMYGTENGEDVLRSLGIKEELINTIIQLDNEQRTSDSLAAARRGRTRNLHVDNDGQGNGRPDGSNQGREPGDVGGEGLRPVRGSSQEAGQTTEDNGVRPSITAENPLDKFIAKHGDNAENKLNKTIEAINKEIANLESKLVEEQRIIDDMPEPFNEETQKAFDKQTKLVEKVGKDLEAARKALAPYTAMREELDARQEAANAVYKIETESVWSNDENLTPEAKQLLTSVDLAMDGAPEEASTSEIRYSYTREPVMRGKSQLFFDRAKGGLTFNEDTFDVCNATIQTMVDIFNEHANDEFDGVRLLPPDDVIKGQNTIFNNGSYGRTMENTTKCLRTLAYDDFVDAVKENLGRPLSTGESFLVSQMLYDIAVDPQCLYCYVSLDRKAYDEFLLRYIQQRDAVIEEYRASGIDKRLRLKPQTAKNGERKGTLGDSPLEQLYSRYLDGREDSPNQRRRFNMWIANADKGLATSDMLATEASRNAAIEQGGEIEKQIRDAQRYAQAASWAKVSADYRAYNGEILRLGQGIIDKLKQEYGLRFYSFSEYSPAFIVENMQMIRDAALRGLNGLACTKEVDFARIFAPSGININISCFGRKADDGTIVMDTKQGADWNEVQDVKKQYPNVAAVFVATDDEQTEWALNQPWIDVVIPFHIVRTGGEVADFYGWINHTAMQADVDTRGHSRDVMPTEHHNDKERFLELCKERGLKPRFADMKLSNGESVTTHPNYMKLVNETRLSIDETVPIHPIFDLQAAKDSFANFVEKGGYYGGWWAVDSEGVKDAVKKVADDIRAGKNANEVEYGRQNIPFRPEVLTRLARKARASKAHGNIPLHAGELGIGESKTMYSITAEQDQAYMDAVNRGDMETAQRMVGEAARKAGYISDNDFRMSHTAPNGRDGFAKSIATPEGIYPEDLYSPQGYNYYGDGDVSMDMESANIFKRLRGNPEALVKIYRAVPKSLKETKLRNGDWVTINRRYAQEHGENNIDGGYKIIEDEVPAKFVYTDGNSLHEQGYDDGNEYAYQNTKNNRKLLDAVTYDDKGNVIPLSKRFNKRNDDIRYSIVNEQGELNYEELDNIIRGQRNELAGLSRIPEEAVGRAVATPAIAAEAIARGVRQANLAEVWGEDKAREHTRELIKQWAKQSGHWYDEARLTEDATEGRGGTESRVFVTNDRKTVRKLTSPVFSQGNIEPYIESLHLFGNVFGESAYDIKGFGENEKGELCVVVEQPYIQGVRLSDSGITKSLDKIREFMESLGFKEYGVSMFENDKFRIEDVNRTNVIVDENGDFHVIDAFVELADESLYKEEPMYSFIGKQGAARMDVKEGAMTRINSLEDARRLEQLLGTDEEAARKIKLATGWERGKDGKWRYEISDDDYAYYPEGLKKFYKENPIDQEMIDLVKKQRSERTEEDNTRLENYIKERNQQIEDYKASQGEITLDDVIDHEELFKAYPSLRNVKVTFKRMDNGTWGHYDEANQEIVLDDRLKTTQQKSTLIHEIQHAIQAKEGFAQGGNPNYIARVVQDMDNNAKIWAYKLALDEAAEQHPEHADDADALLNDILGGMTEEEAINQGWIPDKNLRKVGFKVYQGKYNGDSYEKAYKQWYDKLREAGRTNYFEGTPFELYQRLAGEVEARNTQARMGMTYAERLEQLAKDTEDVSREDQLIMLAGDPVLYSVTANEDTDMGKPSLKEITTEYLLTLAEQNQEDMQALADATKAYNDLISDANKRLKEAARAGQEYGKQRADEIRRLAVMLMRHGRMNDMTRGEVSRLLSAMKNAVDSNLINQAEKVIDILVDHQLKAEEALWNKQLKTKGIKLNDSRVRTQGALGIQAQQILATVNEGIKLSDKAFDDMFADVESQLDDLTDSRKRREAEAKYQGLLIAKKFLDDIRDSKENVAEAKKKMRERLEEIYDFDDEGNRTLKPEFKGHLDEEHKAKKKEVMQFEKEQLRTIREEKMRRADNFAILNAMLGGAIRDGRIEAKEFLERRLQRINDIHHNANSDQLGQNDEEHYEHTPWEKFKGNALFTFAFSPQRNFDEMLRFFAPLSVDGRGYLHRRFMSQYSHARDTEWRGLQRDNEILDAKAKEILGDKKVSKWRNLYAVERRMPKIEVEFYDGTEKDEEGNTVRKKKNHTLTQGQALYIYMTNKQSAGAARLRAMGISEEDVQRIVEQIDPQFIQLADWIQDEFLPQLRERYNEVHERVFGTPLAKNENYFPLRTNAKSRNRKVDLGNENLNDVPSTVTGAIIERQNTIAALDLTHADAFSIVIEHIQEMEHWAAFAEFNSDLQALLNYKRFRTRVENMSSVRFGYGEELFKRFEETAKIAAGTFKPKRDDNNKAAVNVAKGMTASKINFRFYTALKQMSSHPAFWADANITELAKLGFNPAGVVTSVKWAMKELPGFAKRWESRQAGNEMLDESKADWAIWRSNVLQGVSRVGMFSNAGMDAITVAIGAKAVYETKFSQYKKQGYDEAKAKEMALQDASMVYNESQQSQDPAYLSAMQSQRDWLNSGLAMFRNASFGYGRRYYRAITQLKKGIVYLANDEKKKQAIEYATKMGVREGLTEQQAYAAAKKAVNNMALKNLWDVAIYGYIVQFFWNLMPYIPYLVGGDDDDKKEEMLKNIALHSLAGPIEGMPLGNIVSSAFDNYLWHGKDWASYDYNLIPLIADINRVRKAFKNDELAAANDVLNIIIASGIGFDIKGITDGFIAVMDAVNGDPETTIETALLLMRIAEVPQSQLDQLYIDEVGLTGAEASRMPLDALARRLAHYKMKKNNPLLWRLYSDEKREQVEQKYINRIMKEMQNRINSIDDDELENFFNEETDPDIKKMIGKRVAEEYGVKDDESRKPSKTESEESAKSKIVYQKKRTIDDARQDFAIRRARQEAEEAGDTERYKAIDKEWRAIQKLRKDLNGSESDEAVLEQMREAKKAVIEYYNITTQQ